MKILKSCTISAAALLLGLAASPAPVAFAAESQAQERHEAQNNEVAADRQEVHKDWGQEHKDCSVIQRDRVALAKAERVGGYDVQRARKELASDRARCQADIKGISKEGGDIRRDKRQPYGDPDRR
jgi:hypothetical protein